MRPLPEHRPSWLSTILFVFAPCLFTVVIGEWFAWTTLVGPSDGMTAKELDGMRPADIRRWTENEIAKDAMRTRVAVIFGLVGAGLAAWGWRAPRQRRFHITYLSGVGVLVLDLFHLLKHYVARGELVAGDYFSYNTLLEPVGVAILALVFGLVLCLSALILDRPR